MEVFGGVGDDFEFIVGGFECFSVVVVDGCECWISGVEIGLDVVDDVDFVVVGYVFVLC